MNKEEFIKALEELNINITKKQLNDLDTYYKMIIEYNYLILEPEQDFLDWF